MSARLDGERWRALSPYLDRALELTGDERSQWLASLRAEDAAMAADVEALLEEQDALDRDGFLEGHATPVPAPPTLPGEATGASDERPARIGPYRILRELGRGGMGCVYLAEQEGEGFRRLVALKVIEAAGGAGGEIERRFRAERRILAGLEHPGIARFYDAGRAQDGRCFLALEYVEGVDVIEHARRHELPIHDRLRLFLAVEFAHARSIVHRDLKPGNILVGTDGRPRLLDFGIAKLVDPDPEASTTETRTELRALTPAYASPEQFRGERVSSASDIFSLGVVLYELLAGVRPFAPTSTSRAALERAVLTEEPDAPSTAWRRAAAASGAPASGRPTTGSRRSGLGRDLDAICLKALRKQAGDRYASASAFADDLRCYLRGRPVAARIGSRRYRLARLASRHRNRLATAAALALAIAAIGVAAGAYRRAERLRPPEPPAPRPFPFSDVGSIPVEDLQRRFAEQPDSVEAGAALAFGLLDKGRAQEAALIVSRLRQIPGKEQDALTDYTDGTLAMDLDERQAALVLFTRARAGALAHGRGELLAQVRASRGRLLARLGERQEARREMELARDDFRRAGDHASLSRVLNDLAIEELQRGEVSRGATLLEEAVNAGRAAGQAPVFAIENLGVVAFQRGHPEAAERRFREAVALRRETGSARRLGLALAQHSEALRDLGRAREAAPLLEEAIALLRKASEERTLIAALLYRAVGDVAGARIAQTLGTAAEIEDAAQAAGDRVGLGHAHYVRGLAAVARGDLRTGGRHFGEARRLYVDNGELDAASETDVAWAVAEHAAGHVDVALRLLDEALGRLLNGGSGSPPAFFAETLRARIDAEAGLPADARRRLQALGEEMAESPSVSRRLAFLGARARLLRGEGRLDEARRDLDTALRTAREAERTLDSLALRLDRAELELAAGARAVALAAAREVEREASSLGLAALAERARRVTRSPARSAR
jgi:serine/threonine-protein kinase